MVIKQRAVLAEDKQERQQAILDAAERLLRRSPDRMANVAEVADEAGLAKGTVYLYFPSKEELLLALHERHVADFFSALLALLARREPVTIDDILAITGTHMVDEPTFLPLATRCFGIMATEVPPDTAIAFKERMSVRMREAAEGLERHFAQLPAGGGVPLLRHSYALILGLWQMSSTQPIELPVNENEGVEECPMVGFDYAEELARGLRALWRGAVGGATEPILAVAPTRGS
jgi:AcrR family transcriptional regulator